MDVGDALVGLGLLLWLVTVLAWVRLRRLIRTRYPAAWTAYGTPLFVPILDRRRWSPAASRFWWSGYHELGDRQVDRAMRVCGVAFVGMVTVVVALLAWSVLAG